MGKINNCAFTCIECFQITLRFSSDQSEGIYSVLIGCCPFKVIQSKKSAQTTRRCFVLWSDCGAVSLSKTTKSQKCLHKLLTIHIDVVLLCCD